MVKSIKGLSIFSILLVMILQLNGCGPSIEPTNSIDLNKPTESAQLTKPAEIKEPILSHMSNIIGLLKKTPEEVNQLLGDEAKNFKAAPVNHGIIMSDAYEIENLPLESINFHYTSSDYMITGLSLDTNVISYQAAGDDNGVETLDYVEYVFPYAAIDEAEKVWDWIYEQKASLSECFGRTYDFEFGISSYETVKAIPATDSKNGVIQWIFDVEGSSKRNHKITYCYNINMMTDAKIIVGLAVTESYDRFMEGQTDKIKDSVLLKFSDMMELLKKPREEVTNLLGDEAENFKAAAPDKDFIVISEAYAVKDLSLRIHLNYNLNEYMLTDLSPDTNSVSYQAAEEENDAVEVLRNAEYIFHYDTAEEKEQIISWIAEQKEVLTEYFGRPSDLESSPDSLGGQWMLDVKGSEKRNYKMVYCYGMLEWNDDRQISVSLSTYESYSPESSEAGLKK